MTAVVCVPRWDNGGDEVKEVYRMDIDNGLQLFGNAKRKVRMV